MLLKRSTHAPTAGRSAVAYSRIERESCRIAMGSPTRPDNVRAITGRAGTAPRSTDRNYTAGTVRCIGGLADPRRRRVTLLLTDHSFLAAPVKKLRHCPDDAPPSGFEVVRRRGWLGLW